MNHNFIKLNPDVNFNTKKIFFIVFRKIHGEFDWILPLINKFNKNYLFFGIVETKKEKAILEKNIFLNNHFKKNFHGYFIENKFKSIILKIILKIFVTLNLPFKKKISEIYKNNYYSCNDLLSVISTQYNLSNLKKINIFLSYDKLQNNWEEEFSKQENSSTYYFPSSCSLKPLEKTILKENQTIVKNKYLILSNDLDYIYWKNLYPHLKQIVVGYPRFNKIWIENIPQVKNKSDITTIYLSYRRDLQDEKWFSKAIAQIEMIKNILRCIDKNFEIYVKIHPYTNQSEIDDYLRNEKNIKFIFSHLHQQEICKLSDFSINFFRSASIMDSLSTKTPAIELSKISDEKFGSPYKDNNISFYADNKNILEEYIKKFSENDIEIKEEFKIKYKIFERTCLLKNPVILFEEFLNLKRNTINNRS